MRMRSREEVDRIVNRILETYSNPKGFYVRSSYWEREEFRRALEEYVIERADWEEDEIVKRAEAVMRAVENVIKHRAERTWEKC